MRYLDLETWPRKEHFHFFRTYEEPFFGMTVEIDCTHAVGQTKRKGTSFFLFYLHKCLQAINELEPFRYRIEGEQICIHDQVNASCTIGRGDGTFGYGRIVYFKDFHEFETQAKATIAQVQASNDLFPSTSNSNVIHFSSIPWTRFTSVSHARKFSREDSVPKVVVGKAVQEDGRWKMPVSVHAHHALMDGVHVSQYLDLFEQLLNVDAQSTIQV